MLLFMTTLSYIWDITWVVKKSWDIETCTVTDYAAQYEVPREVFERYESENPDDEWPVYGF